MSLYDQAKVRLGQPGKWDKEKFPTFKNKVELVVGIISRCRVELESSTKDEESIYKAIICVNGRTEAQYDKDLKNFIFVVFEESDTRIGGNESIHTILPTEAHVLDAAAVAPEKEREIVMLVAGAVVKYRSPPIRQQRLSDFFERLRNVRATFESKAKESVDADAEDTLRKKNAAAAAAQIRANFAKVPKLSRRPITQMQKK